MAVNDIYQVTVVGALHGQTTNSVLHYRESSTGTGDPSALLVAAADAALGAAFKTFCSVQWAYSYTQAQKIWPAPMLVAVTNSATAGAGAIGAVSEPSEVAVVITKRSALAGRANRGRVFVPGIDTTYVTDSKVNGTGLTPLATLATALRQPITSGGWTWDAAIYQRASNSTIPWITSAGQSILRSQRRRQLGKGS